MSDFIADLERELVAAARRRATRRRVMLVPRPRPVLVAVALVALVFAAVAVVRGLDDGSRSGDERPELPTPSGATFTLPAAPVAQPCPGVEQREVAGGFQAPMSVFTRPPTTADALPQLPGTDSYSWIPAGVIHRVDARRAAPEQFDAAVYLVPAAELRQDGACDGRKEANIAVCLVVVDGETVVKCFDDDEVEGGRAVAVTARGVAYGVVPVQVERVVLHAPGGNVAADVHDSVFEVPIRAKAGDEVRMDLTRGRQCRPSDELLDAVPALRDGRWGAVPSEVEDALPAGGVPRWARRIDTGGRLELWLLAHCDAAQRACVVASLRGASVAQPCATERQIRSRRENWSIVPVGERLGIAGIAPQGTTRVEVVDGDDLHEVPLTDGVYGGLLPPSFGRPVGRGERDPAEGLVVRIR